MVRTKTAVCVCSGGIDSTVAATIALQESYELHFFHASYGQRAENREKEAVERIAAYLGAKDLKFAEIPFLKELGGSSLTDIRSRVPVGEEVNLGKEKEMLWSNSLPSMSTSINLEPYRVFVILS